MCAESTTNSSCNAGSKLPGSDPALQDEFVVLSAHIDHLGIGAAINGDRIYNGAMDNGSGSALVLDMAANLKAHPQTVKRSILFLLVTAEEKGLLGSKYFAAHPTIPLKSIVADVNVDMFLPIVPLKILTIQGIDESDLGARAAAIAESMGIKPIADPEPLRNRYHAPSDDVNQPVDLGTAAGYEEFTRRLLLDTVNAADRPEWKKDSFFRRYATPN